MIFWNWIKLILFLFFFSSFEKIVFLGCFFSRIPKKKVFVLPFKKKNDQTTCFFLAFSLFKILIGLSYLRRDTLVKIAGGGSLILYPGLHVRIIGIICLIWIIGLRFSRSNQLNPTNWYSWYNQSNRSNLSNFYGYNQSDRNGTLSTQMVWCLPW